MPSGVRIGRWLCRLVLALVIALSFAGAPPAITAEPHPLQPADTSSPRALLQDFISSGDETYSRATKMMRQYLVSDRLYFNAEERQMLLGVAETASRLVHALDISHIPPA